MGIGNRITKAKQVKLGGSSKNSNSKQPSNNNKLSDSDRDELYNSLDNYYEYIFDGVSQDDVPRKSLDKKLQKFKETGDIDLAEEIILDMQDYGGGDGDYKEVVMEEVGSSNLSAPTRKRLIKFIDENM